MGKRQYTGTKVTLLTASAGALILGTAYLGSTQGYSADDGLQASDVFDETTITAETAPATAASTTAAARTATTGSAQAAATATPTTRAATPTATPTTSTSRATTSRGS